MRTIFRWMMVAACASLATCRGSGPARNAPVRRPTAVPTPSTEQVHFAREAVRQQGAAPDVRNPNESVADTDLGAHVTARRLSVPSLAVGRSARFHVDEHRRAWVVQLAHDAQLSSVSYARGRVYVGGGFASTVVYAMDSETGTLRWTGQTPDGGPTAAIIEDDTVLFNTESCTLFAFDRASGRQRWSRWLGDPLMSQPAAAHGRVFSAWPAGGSFLFGAMSVRHGTPLWSRSIGADVITAPVIDGDAVYITTMDGVVRRFDARTGRVAWRRSISATSAPAVADGALFIAQRMPGGRERQLTLSAATGTRTASGEATRAPYAAARANATGVEAGWSYEGSRPTHVDGRVYYAMGDRIVARDAQAGRVLWERHYPHEFSRRGMTSPAVVAGSVVMGTRHGDVFGLDVDTGMTTWAFNVGEPIVFQPTVANGWVYVTTARGKVIGLEIGDRGFDGWHMWGGNAQHNGLNASEPASATSATAADDRPSQGTLRVDRRGGRAFPLLHTTVRAAVSGFVARVTVEQSFSNPNRETVNAEYLFPLPADSAVDAMEMHIGTRVVRGEIQRREAARANYQRARDCGQHAALLEQERPNLFRQAVANIRPGETLRVVLSFAETVPYRDGTYEFVMPLSTGSRFTPGVGGTTPSRPDGDVEVHARVDMGLDLAEVMSPSHTVDVQHDGAHAVRVALRAGSTVADRDFILRYRPRVEVVEPTFLADRAGPEGFFTFALHPNAAATDADITPREVVFAIDTSSSMRGPALERARALVHRALDRLRPGDSFRLVAFSDTVRAFAPDATAINAASRARAHAFIDALRAGGTTDMGPALRTALTAPDDATRLRLVVLVTDGYVGNERDVLAAIERQLGTSRLFTFGVGASVNRYLLEQAAEVGRGHAEVVTLSEDPAAAADRFYTHIDRPYLTDVAIDWGTLPIRDVYPRYVPDLFAGRPVLVHGRYASAAAGDVRVSGRIRGRPWSRVVRVALPERAHDHEALPSVWARARVHDLTRAMLLGEVTALRDEVIDLGLRHHLVTDYTSFVAIDRDEAATGACAGSVPTQTHDTGYGGLGMIGTGFGGGGVGYGTASAFGSSGLGASLGLRGRSVSVPLVRAAAPVVVGLMAPETVRRVVLRNLGQVQHCYEQSLVANPTLSGRVTMRIVLAEDGSVLGAAVAESGPGLGAVGTCVSNAIRRWTFDAPANGGITTINYPFVFQPADEERPRPNRFVVPIAD